MAFFGFLICKLGVFRRLGLPSKWLLLLFATKLVAAFALVGVYQIVYEDENTGDINKYHKAGLVLYSAMEDSPADYFKMVSGICADEPQLEYYYDKAIEKFPNLFVAYSGKLKSLVALGRWGDVVECGRKAIEVNTNHDDGYFYTAVAMCQLDRYDEAEQYFNKALERNPNNYVAYFNLAYVYSLRGDMQTAERMQQRGEQLQMQQSDNGK